MRDPETEVVPDTASEESNFIGEATKYSKPPKAIDPDSVGK